jgi:hypothetical protein
MTPRLDILLDPQRALWHELATIPSEFVLYGGTAVALHLGHRQSIDFDFFANRPLDTAQLNAALPFLETATITQREPNTLSVVVDRGGPVRLSFFGVPALPRLAPPRIAFDTAIKIASLLDLAGTKVNVVQLRAEARDYLDIDAILTDGGIDLPTALAAAQALYGPTFNAQNALKALCFFDEGNLRDLAPAIKARLAKAVRDVDLDRLPAMPGPQDTSAEPGQ